MRRSSVSGYRGAAALDELLRTFAEERFQLGAHNPIDFPAGFDFAGPEAAPDAGQPYTATTWSPFAVPMVRPFT